MKIAFAQWGERIAPVFDTARRIHVIETEAGNIVAEKPHFLSEDLSVQKTLRLVALRIDTLVCGAISRPMQEMISAHGIEVIPFVAGGLRQVIEAWCRGDLMSDAFSMPGCRRRGRQRQRHRAKFSTVREVTTMKAKGRGQGAGAGKSQGRGQGQGRGGQRPGRKGGGAAGADFGFCVCPQCGRQQAHQRGMPCVEQQCPKCGIALIRNN